MAFEMISAPFFRQTFRFNVVCFWGGNISIQNKFICSDRTRTAETNQDQDRRQDLNSEQWVFHRGSKLCGIFFEFLMPADGQMSCSQPNDFKPTSIILLEGVNLASDGKLAGPLLNAGYDV